VDVAGGHVTVTGLAKTPDNPHRDSPIAAIDRYS
jgi:hypothetical protein